MFMFVVFLCVYTVYGVCLSNVYTTCCEGFSGWTLFYDNRIKFRLFQEWGGNVCCI